MTSTRCKVLAVLSDTQWMRTKEIALRAGISPPLAVHHLNILEAQGHALSRGGHGCIKEWCWVPGGYANQCLQTEVAPILNGTPY